MHGGDLSASVLCVEPFGDGGDLLASLLCVEPFEHGGNILASLSPFRKQVVILCEL